MEACDVSLAQSEFCAGRCVGLVLDMRPSLHQMSPVVFSHDIIRRVGGRTSGGSDVRRVGGAGGVGGSEDLEVGGPDDAVASEGRRTLLSEVLRFSAQIRGGGACGLPPPLSSDTGRQISHVKSWLGTSH